ncbi:MAG: hypothetical protein DI609_12620 [Corynebacterium urealyticum]|uniref:Uncharacterized protein n=1 Tax=Corynebacterium urealyticum TaxID=43771 RepID=A0A2W5CRU7_9CORY|nr:MAG: hypothetical protein DI609_12620 [Corynebacterium urealyticum]
MTWENAPLIAAAPALAELVANMRYEYAVEVVWGKNVTYAYKDDTGKGQFGPLAVWSWTRGDAAEFVAELKDFTPHTTARVVRRLAGESEVVE